MWQIKKIPASAWYPVCRWMWLKWVYITIIVL